LKGGRKMEKYFRFHTSASLFVLGLLLFILFSGCAPISKELRAEAGQKLTFQQVFQNPEAYKGKIVIWGGEIIQTINQKDKTTLIEVLQRPLDWQEEPKEAETSGGRFLILVERFLDPHIYKKGREITVAGEILGEKTRPLGEMQYRYPFVLSKQIYLWREYGYSYPPPYYPSPYYPYYPWGYDYPDYPRGWDYNPWWDYPYW
jgi:outer membrane lipoprotein